VLFSEPKIPQSRYTVSVTVLFRSFSALQRAENSSIQRAVAGLRRHARVSVLFSEPKIPQSTATGAPPRARPVSVLFSEPKIPQLKRPTRGSTSSISRFSALQRAENSSIKRRAGLFSLKTRCFSALQRAENSSMIETTRRFSADRNVSVLFSEPKIPQCSRSAL